MSRGLLNSLQPSFDPRARSASEKPLEINAKCRCLQPFCSNCSMKSMPFAACIFTSEIIRSAQLVPMGQGHFWTRWRGHMPGSGNVKTSYPRLSNSFQREKRIRGSSSKMTARSLKAQGPSAKEPAGKAFERIIGPGHDLERKRNPAGEEHPRCQDITSL